MFSDTHNNGEEDCQGLSHLTAYKNQEEGVMAISGFNYMQAEYVIVVDNWYGICLMEAKGGTKAVAQVELSHTRIIGTSPVPDS